MTANQSLMRTLVEVGIDTRGDNVSVAGVEDFGVRQMVHFMNQAGRDVVQRAEWPSTYRLKLLPINVGFEVDIFAAIDVEFRAFGTGGGVVYADEVVSRVMLNSTTWVAIKSGVLDSPFCFVENNTQLRSTRDLGNCRISYLSWGWVKHGVDDFSRYITGDGDTFEVPEHLVELGAVWRWKRSKQLPYDGELKEYEAEIAINARNQKNA